jgi:hypothetical protein
MRELELGLPEVKFLRNGNHLDPYCGSMGNVESLLPLFTFIETDDPHHSWFREKYLEVCGSYHISVRSCLISPESSAIIRDLDATSKLGLSSTAFYFFDFRADAKQTLRGLLSSLLVQLCDQSGACYKFLWDLYSMVREGSRRASDDELMKCLENMVTSQGQAPVYIVIDALDECPNTSGITSERESVLSALKNLFDLDCPSLRICITSRPEQDIKETLRPLASQSLSLHDQHGQKEDILFYITSVVDQIATKKKWRLEDRQLVINTLSDKADGM